MQRIMTLVWLVQATLSLVMAVCYLAVPERWHRLFHNVDLPRMLALNHPTPPPGVSAESMLMAVTVLRSDAEAIVTALRVMSVPAALLVFMSVYAAMRTDEETRRYIARTFGVVLSYWAATLALKAPLGLVIHLGSRVYRSPAGDHILHTANEARLFYVIAAFAAINFAHGFIPARNRRERALSGMANTRPPLLWVLWAVQCTLLLFVAGLVTYLTWGGAREIDITFADESLPRVAQAFRELKLGAPGLPYNFLLADVLEALPPMCVAIALFTFHAMLPSRQWVWRSLAGAFALHFASLVVVTGIVYEEGLLRPWVLPSVAVPAFVLACFNLYYARLEREYFTRETHGPDGWLLTDLIAGPSLFARTVLRGGRRARNAAGVGARGRLEVSAPPADAKLPEAVPKALPGDSMAPIAPPARPIPSLPPHDFFSAPADAPAAPFDVTARFSNATRDDDTAVDARGVALDITNPRGDRFVLYFATGAYAEAAHMLDYAAAKVMARVGALVPRRLDRKPWVRREARVGADRRPPTSYLELTYHSQTVRFWVGIDHVRYLVRYRLVPCDLSAREREEREHEARLKRTLDVEHGATIARHARALRALKAQEESELAQLEGHIAERGARDADERDARADRDGRERYELIERHAARREALRAEHRGECDALHLENAEALRALRARRLSLATDEAGSTTAAPERQVSSEHRASDCLRSELKRTLETQRPDVPTGEARAKMRLQAQLHRFANGDSAHWYNPSVDWRADDHPWVDVGTLVLHAVMPDDEAESHCFDLSACPHSLGVPEGIAPTDFRSLGDSQRRIVGRIQSTRARLLVAFGVPAAPNAPKDR